VTSLATCSFGAYHPRMGAGVRVTLGVPRFPPPPMPGRFRWPYLAEAAPRGWYFRASPQKFERCYLSQLNHFAGDIEMKLGWLAERFPDSPLIACCFERRVSEGECHRLLFGRWLQDRLGTEVPELDPRKEIRSSPSTNTRLPS
jgi:hypothetical protein